MICSVSGPISHPCSYSHIHPHGCPAIFAAPLHARDPCVALSPPHDLAMNPSFCAMLRTIPWPVSHACVHSSRLACPDFVGICFLASILPADSHHGRQYNTVNSQQHPVVALPPK